jgi:hypothetical protein
MSVLALSFIIYLFSIIYSRRSTGTDDLHHSSIIYSSKTFGPDTTMQDPRRTHAGPEYRARVMASAGYHIGVMTLLNMSAATTPAIVPITSPASEPPCDLGVA